jgi:tetratricopeptide (TPR) repeat protein
VLLDEASTDGIVMPLGPGSYRFAHALIRAGVYDALDTNTRIRLHREVGEAIENIYPKELRAHVAELAHHFRAARVTDKAIKYSSRASRAAFEVFSYADAATHLREALAMSEGQNDLRRADMLLGLARVTAFHLNVVEGIPLLEQVLSLYRELKNEERVALTNVLLGEALSSQADFAPGMNVPRAQEYFRHAQAWKGEWPDPGTLGALSAGLATSFLQSNQIDEAIEASKQATQIWKRASNSAWITSASQWARLLVIKGRHREAAALFDEVAAVAQEATDPELYRTVMWIAGWSRNVMRDPIEAKRFLTMGMERKGLSPQTREFHFEFLAIVELMAGNLTRAKALAAEHRVMPGFRSNIAFREGDWEAAIEMNLPMLDWARRTGHRWDEVDSLATLCALLRITGDFQRAAEFFQQLLRASEPSDLWQEMRIRPSAALLAIEAGRSEEAVQHLEICRAIVAQGEDWLGLISAVERAEAMLAAAIIVT